MGLTNEALDVNPL